MEGIEGIEDYVMENLKAASERWTRDCVVVNEEIRNRMRWVKVVCVQYVLKTEKFAMVRVRGFEVFVTIPFKLKRYNYVQNVKSKTNKTYI